MRTPSYEPTTYERAMQQAKLRHQDDKPWHADEMRQKLEALGIDPENLVEYLQWLRETPR